MFFWDWIMTYDPITITILNSHEALGRLVSCPGNPHQHSPPCRAQGPSVQSAFEDWLWLILKSVNQIRVPFVLKHQRAFKKINETICFSNLQRQTQNYDYLHAITLLFRQFWRIYTFYKECVKECKFSDIDFTKGQMLVIRTNTEYLSSSYCLCNRQLTWLIISHDAQGVPFEKMN